MCICDEARQPGYKISEQRHQSKNIQLQKTYMVAMLVDSKFD